MQRRIISYSYIKQVVNDVCSNYHIPRHREAFQVFFFFSRLKKKFTGFFFQSSIGSAPVAIFFLFLFPLMVDEACRLQARPLGACMHGTGGTPGKNTVALVQLSMFARLRIRDRRIVGGSDSLEYCRPAHARPLENAFDLPLCAVVLAVSQTVINQAMSMRVSRFDCQCFSTDFPSFHCSLSLYLSRGGFGRLCLVEVG